MNRMTETSFDQDDFFDSKQSLDDDFFHDASDRLHADMDSVKEHSGIAEDGCSLSQDSDEEGLSSSEFSYDEDSEEERHSKQNSEDSEDLPLKKDGNEEICHGRAEEKKIFLESGTGSQVKDGYRKDEEEVAKSKVEKDAIETAGKMVRLNEEGSLSLDQNQSILEKDNQYENKGKTKNDAKVAEELGTKEETRVRIQKDAESLAKKQAKVNMEGEEAKDEKVKLKTEVKKEEEERKIVLQLGAEDHSTSSCEKKAELLVEVEAEKDDELKAEKNNVAQELAQSNSKEDTMLKIEEEAESEAEQKTRVNPVKKFEVQSKLVGNDVENEENYNIKEEVEKEDKSDEEKEKEDNVLKLTEQTVKLVTQKPFLEADKEEKEEILDMETSLKQEDTSIEKKKTVLDDESRLDSKESTGDTKREMVHIQPEDDAKHNSEKEATVAKKEGVQVAIEDELCNFQTKVEEECKEQTECPQDVSKKNLGSLEGGTEGLKNTTKTLKEGTSTMIQTELSLESENVVRLSNSKETEISTAPIVGKTLNEEVMVEKDVKEDEEIANLNKDGEPGEIVSSEKDNMKSEKLYDIKLSQAEHTSIKKEEKTTCDRSLPGVAAIAEGSSEKENTQLNKDKSYDTKRLHEVGSGGCADDDAALHEKYQKAASKNCGGCIMC